MYTKFDWVWLEFSFLTLSPPSFWSGWKIEGLDFWNFSSVVSQTLLEGEISWSCNDCKYHICFDKPSVSQWVSEWVNQWVPKLAIFSGPYRRIYLSYIIEIWHSPQDGLHNYMSIISARYLKWIPRCSWVEIGSNWLVSVKISCFQLSSVV